MILKVETFDTNITKANIPEEVLRILKEKDVKPVIAEAHNGTRYEVFLIDVNGLVYGKK